MAELKKQDGKVSPAQQEWLDALGQCPGVECYLWKPSDRDRIQEVLAPCPRSAAASPSWTL